MTFDVAIVGGGLVGASLAAALVRTGLAIALIEAGDGPVVQQAGAWDSRVYAISPGSAAFLCECGAWQALDRSRLQPVESMEVHGDLPGARLRFDAYESGLPALCHIVESSALERALATVLARADHVTRFAPARPASMAFDARSAMLTLAGGRTIEARLVVGADGASSWARRSAGIEERVHEYGQSGVVANFAAREPHGGTARQWFRADGVLALLPLPGNRVSMVWSTGHDHAAVLLALDPQALADRVAEAATLAPGTLAVVTPPRAFPLRSLAVASPVRPRLALIGDAAHNVHPLAGQGVNLGFGDARALAAALAARGPQDDCGDLALLRRYHRGRVEAVATMRGVTDGLQRLFAGRGPGLRWLRNAGLVLTDHLSPIKHGLIHHALG